MRNALSRQCAEGRLSVKRSEALRQRTSSSSIVFQTCKCLRNDAAHPTRELLFALDTDRIGAYVGSIGGFQGEGFIERFGGIRLQPGEVKQRFAFVHQWNTGLTDQKTVPGRSDLKFGIAKRI